MRHKRTQPEAPAERVSPSPAGADFLEREMTCEIEYRNSAGQLEEAMRIVPVDRAEIIAQKAMAQFPSFATAHILTADSEIVVSRATRWQKLNG